MAASAVAFAQARTAKGAEQVALVAMTPDGRVRAMLGGRAYAASQFNRVTQAERQPSSAFKLFVYLAGLEAGLRPEDRISAAPIQVNGWAPRNLDDRYPTSISLLDSFAQSVNTAAVGGVTELLASPPGRRTPSRPAPTSRSRSSRTR